MEINWYPGHMAKAKRIMQDSVKAVDVIIEVVDARIPYSSRNPDFDDLFANKARVVLLNKADLADPERTAVWVDWYREQGIHTIPFVAVNGKQKKTVADYIASAASEKVQRMAQRGAKKTVRAMVVGIPNVGKSAFINVFAGSAAAKVANRPGVTRGKQIIRITPWLELLDTPGVLWPKLEDEQGALRLALTGAIKDEIMNTYGLSRELIVFLEREYPQLLIDRYQITLPMETPEHGLEELCRNRGFLRHGGELDMDRAARTLLDEMRAGKLGRISLELPRDLSEGEDKVNEPSFDF